MISSTNRKRSAAIIRPPPRLTISAWAEANAWIPEEGNAEPGKYHLRRMPHQQAMLDDPLQPGVRETIWMMASQFSGKTLCLILICEFVIHQLRKSILMSRDTKERALEWMRDKFIPAIKATPCMEGLLKDPRSSKSESTSLSRKFPGGTFKIIGAKSRGAFRSVSSGKVFQDEIDAYETTKEGDPCELIDRAAKTFSDAWKIKCSTTTLLGFSKIHAKFLAGDQQYFFLPCPCCGEFQWLKDEQLKFSFTAEESARIDQPGYNPNDYTWSIGKHTIYRTRDAIYVCEHCNRGWTDLQRLESYKSGSPDNPPVIVNGKDLRAEWRATAPFSGIRSRWLSGMYASIGLEKGFDNYLHQFSELFLKAKREGRESLMAWTNMFANKPFEDPAEKLDWKFLKDRAENYDPDGEIPAQIVWIDFGIDVHPDRVEMLFLGWGDGQEVWTLTHHIEWGDFDMPSMQDRVWDYLENKRFKHPILGDLKWSAGGIDSGHQTKVKAVYQFAAKHRLSNIFSVKGFEELGGATVQGKKEKLYGGLRLNMNTDYLKTTLFDRLRNKEPGPRFVHFPTERQGLYGEVFYTQLCSEKRMPVKMGTGIVHRWIKHTSSTRNEVLDMFVYAFGVFEISRQQEWIARKWKEVAAKIRELNPPAAVEKREMILNKPEEIKRPDLPAHQPHQPRPRRRRFMMANSPFATRF